MKMPFSKESKATPVIEKSEIEQGVEQPREPEKIDVVLNNQKVIVENQRLIFEAIQQLGQLMIKLAGEEEPPRKTVVRKRD